MFALAPALPPLPVSSVLLPGDGSFSVAATVTRLSNGPEATMLALTLIVTLAPLDRLAMVHGKAAHPAPLTLLMARLAGVSVTWIAVAVLGPTLLTTIE